MKPQPESQFPLEAIPQPLHGMALTFSHRYAAPPGHTVMAMLGALGAAVGNQVEFEPWPGQSVVGGINCLLVGQSPVVEAVWGPLLVTQRALVLWLLGRDAESLDREEERVARDRDHYVERIPARPDDRLHFDEQLADIRLARWPAVRINPVGSIQTAGHAAVLFGPGRSGLAIDHWASDAGAQEREHLVAGWHPAADSRTCMMSSGPVSVMMVANSDDAARFLTAPWAVRSGLAGTFLVVGDNEPIELDEFAATGADHWGPLVQGLFCWRHQGNTMICRPAAEARRPLDELALELASLRMPEPHRNLRSWHQQALRLTLLLHLGTGDPQAPVSAETVQSAVALTRWLVGQAHSTEPQRDRLEEFVRGNLVTTPGARLTVTQSYDDFALHCQRDGIPTPSRQEYTGRFTHLVEEIHGIRLRKDVLGPNGKQQSGWCGIDLVENERPADKEIKSTQTELPVLPEVPVLPVLPAPAQPPTNEIDFLV